MAQKPITHATDSRVIAGFWNNSQSSASASRTDSAPSAISVHSLLMLRRSRYALTICSTPCAAAQPMISAIKVSA